MKKILLITSLVICALSMAQISASTRSNNSKWTFGGNAGLGGSFGSNGGGTSLYITPRVGYQFTKNFEGGLSGNFTWNNSNEFSSTIFGFGPFFNYYFGRTVYLTGQFQEFFINQNHKRSDFKYKDNESALYLGGGYMQRIGSRTFMQFGFTYNVLYDADDSIFSGGFIPQIGIVYGL